jgi:hypothetical protein
MKRLRIAGIVDILRVADSAQIATLADDARLDRAYVAEGPLLNRIVISRIRKILALNGAPLPAVAPRGVERPTTGQAALEARLNSIAAALKEDDPALRPLAAYVRGDGAIHSVGPLAQEAVGRLFQADYEADAQSWAAAVVLDRAPRTFNPIVLVLWALTGRVAMARQLLADKVAGDPSGLHGTGVAVHNIVAGVERMRALWADSRARRQLSPEAAAAQCLVAPQQVVRQPLEAGSSRAGDFDETTLVLLQLGIAHARSPSARTAFMAQSWSRCPAHSWVPALLMGVWRAAQGKPDGP